MITELIIPDSITEGVETAFCNTSIRSIVVSEENKNYKSIDGVLYNKDGTELLLYVGDKEIEDFYIPQGVTSVSSLAFFHCYNIKRIIIPKSVVSCYCSFEQCGASIYCETEIEYPQNGWNLNHGMSLWCHDVHYYSDIQKEAKEVEEKIGYRYTIYYWYYDENGKIVDW